MLACSYTLSIEAYYVAWYVDWRSKVISNTIQAVPSLMISLQSCFDCSHILTTLHNHLQTVSVYMLMARLKEKFENDEC